jgi:hypothetical protein
MNLFRPVGALVPALLATTPVCTLAAGTESIEFVSEHLPEIAMDNRYASLPLWAPAPDSGERLWGRSFTVSFARLRSGDLSLAGPALSVGLDRRIGEAWTLGVFGFIDDLRFSGGPDQRPLDVSFARAVPLPLPVAAEFANLTGTARHIGLGFAMRRDAERWLLGKYQWTAGLLWQQLALRDYRIGYRVLTGASAGVTGNLDYSATYTHFAPFAGIAWPRDHGPWAFTPHAQIAMPLPRRGVVGRITGPNFDIRGDAARVGNGKHFGDPSLTLGWDITYQPWHLTVDLGTTVWQYLLEPLTHEGVNQTWLISVRWAD